MTRIFLSIGECMMEFTTNGENDFRLRFAGDTFNTAWNYRLSADPANWTTRYFTRVGTDPYSSKMLAFMAKNGIDTNGITCDANRQLGLYLVETLNGERSFTYWRNQSAARLLADDADILAEACGNANAIYFSGITMAILSPEARTAFLKQIAEAKANGKTVAFDPNIRPSLWENVETMKQTISAAAAASLIVLPSYEDESTVFGDKTLEDCANRYLALGASEVIVKNGGGPMVFGVPGELTNIAAFPTVVPVDTTGAGDAFNGGYLASRLSGADFQTAVRCGHELASQTVQHRGALLPMKNTLNDANGNSKS